MRRRLKFWPKFLVLVLVLAGLYYLTRWYERKIMYAPDPMLAAKPAKIGLSFQEVALDSSDDVEIHGWYVPAEETAPVVLLLHGRAGNISHCLQKLRFFHDIGLNVLVIDYRGYGESSGTPSELGLQSDALSAYLHLTGTRGIPADRIFVYGESLGAAVAIDLASRVPFAGLIVEAPFTSATDILETSRPSIPWGLLLRDKYDSLGKIRQIGMPVLFLHSSDDEQIPYRHSQKLFASAHEPRKLITLRGSHNEALVNSFDLYSDEVTAFVEAHVSKASEQAPGQTPRISSGN